MLHLESDDLVHFQAVKREKRERAAQLREQKEQQRIEEKQAKEQQIRTEAEEKERLKCAAADNLATAASRHNEQALVDAIAEAVRLKVNKEVVEEARMQLKKLRRTLPAGWRVEERPRVGQTYVDRVYFSPANKRYSSLAAVHRALADKKPAPTACYAPANFDYDFLPHAIFDRTIEECVVCSDGGELVGCDMCERFFHPKCVKLDDVPEDEWICALHSCAGCQRSAQKAPVVVHCIGCARAFCQQCKQARTFGTKWWVCGRCADSASGATRAVLNGVLGQLVGNHHEKTLYFYRPVDPATCPDYADCISTPMNLEAITSRNRRGGYQSIEEFGVDMRLIGINCREYCTSRFPALVHIVNELMQVVKELLVTAAEVRAAIKVPEKLTELNSTTGDANDDTTKPADDDSLEPASKRIKLAHSGNDADGSAGEQSNGHALESALPGRVNEPAADAPAEATDRVTAEEEQAAGSKDDEVQDDMLELVRLGQQEAEAWGVMETEPPVLSLKVLLLLQPAVAATTAATTAAAAAAARLSVLQLLLL